MARALRLEEPGFYHVLNRGVAKGITFRENTDYVKFLHIVQEAGLQYGFEVCSFCLMNNHYHLLLRTQDKNLSGLMQKIGSRYTIYYNKKYDRVGPLWQGRFKSWYVYDTRYLHTLVRYIECNPIKAGITQKIGQYPWAMSTGGFSFSVLNYELLQAADLEKELSKADLAELDELYTIKLEGERQRGGSHESSESSASRAGTDNKGGSTGTPGKERAPLSHYFEQFFQAKDGSQDSQDSHDAAGIKLSGQDREAIDARMFQALQDGYSATQIARFLSLSKASISQRVKKHTQKEQLFAKLRNKGLLWSYAKDLNYRELVTDGATSAGKPAGATESAKPSTRPAEAAGLLIEHTLKYADFDDIKLCFELFGKRTVKKVWERRMKSDQRFIKTNLMLARLFFRMDVESSYFKEAKNGQLEKLRVRAS